MTMRRKIILAIGGMFALVGSGAAWRVTRVPTQAYEPWTVRNEADLDPRLNVLRHAILAPNPHNMQPWLIRLIDQYRAEITCDLTRRLPQTDPFDRQIVIGFGCFLELATIAASLSGLQVEVESFPQGAGQPRLDQRPVAHLRFTPRPNQAVDPLAHAIRARRSAKVPYDRARPLPREHFEALHAANSDAIRLGYAQDDGVVQALRNLAFTAFEREFRTPRTLRESIDVLRVGAREIDASPDGIPLSGPMFEALSLMGPDQVRMSAMDPQSMNTTRQIEKYRQLFEATPAFIWLIGNGNSRTDQLAAGGSYMRLNLLATSLGLGLHPVSQALQEYPEMASLYAEARRLCGVGEGETLQMLARLGYAENVPPTPRWPLEAKLVHT
jgi:nitroreductase